MDKIETYELETPEPKPLPATTPAPLAKSSRFRNLMFIFLGIVIGGAIVAGLAYSGVAKDFILTDGACDKLVENGTLEGFFIGNERAAIILTNESINCRPIPMSYSGYNYTLIAAECLNLNNTGGQK